MSNNLRATEPLYKQVEDALRQDINSGVYKKGHRLPTELELSEKYNVSRITVRNAMKELVKENALIRYRKKGTFVAGNKKALRKITKLSSFSAVCREQGLAPGSKVIKSVYETATPADCEHLGLVGGARVIVIERIRYADYMPVAFEINRFPERFSFLLNIDLNSRSLYDVLQRDFSITPSDSTKTIELAFAGFETAQYLGIEEGYPIISIHGTVSDNEGGAIYHGQQFIVGDKFRIIV